MKKIIIGVILTITSIMFIHPKVSIAMADMTADITFLDGNDEKYYSDILFSNLYDKGKDKGYTYLLARSIGTGKVTDWKIKNEIDAFAVADNIGLNYLIYGTIVTNDKYYESVFKIYSKKDDKVLKEIVYKCPVEDRNVFINETTFKIDIAVYDLLKPDIGNNYEKISEDIDQYNRNKDFKERFRNFRLYEYLGFSFSAGYAVPCGDWSNLFIGIINLETGIRIVRLPNLYTKDFFRLSIRPGFVFSYTLAKNRPEIVEEYFNSFSFKFPAELLFIFKDKYIINFNVDVHVRVDHYYQNLYDKLRNYYTTTTFGWSTGLGFEYEIDKAGVVTVGLNNFVDFAVYDVFYFDYKIQSYLIIKIKENKRPEKINAEDIKIKL